jgi:hypothetical protein
MSAISELEAIFKTLKPNGTFNFTSEARQDQFTRNIDSANFPIFLIDDEVNTPFIIQEGLNIQESPGLRCYFLTKFKTDTNPSEFDELRINQEIELVEPMKELGITVISKYLRESTSVVNQAGDLHEGTIIDQYDIWSTGLCGVLITFQEPRRRTINYCNS